MTEDELIKMDKLVQRTIGGLNEALPDIDSTDRLAGKVVDAAMALRALEKAILVRRAALRRV